jgi:hypothetical protein
VGCPRAWATEALHKLYQQKGGDAAPPSLTWEYIRDSHKNKKPHFKEDSVVLEIEAKSDQNIIKQLSSFIWNKASTAITFSFVAYTFLVISSGICYIFQIYFEQQVTLIIPLVLMNRGTKCTCPL